MDLLTHLPTVTLKVVAAAVVVTHGKEPISAQANVLLNVFAEVWDVLCDWAVADGFGEQFAIKNCEAPFGGFGRCWLQWF